MKPTIFSSHADSPAEMRQPGAHLPRRTPRAKSGVALVVTLIMLSVITFMAITFLVLSRSEHGAVAVETDQTQARLAAETALQRAIAQALAPMMAQTNEFRYGLLVSTNYINPLGFAPGIANATNVNYEYKVGGSKTFSYQEWAQNIDNLWFDPRPPVFITNRFSALGGYEFRFFHNLNRNTNLLGAVFDPTGWLAVTNNGQPVGTLFDWFTGDPQWIGILNSPDRPHGPDNRFLSRFAYLVVPAGSALDMNYIFNQATLTNPPFTIDPNGGNYLRNQGVGPWEGNLASFLCDLNTNLWLAGYHYNPYDGFPTQGNAFADACSLIRYRYDCTNNLTLNLAKLPSFLNLFPNGQTALRSDGLDGYSAGPLMGVAWAPVPDPDWTRGTLPWAGANNTNHFLTPQELFDPAKTSPAFVGRLMAAGNDTTSSYNEYTFYRMLAQLGSDSAGDGGRINLNYRNVDDYGHVVPNAETNFVPWLPDQFFTNAANALLRTYGYNFTVTNIQIYPTNFYTPNVHRLLQLAANIYDASTNRYGGFPTVFKPYFRRTLDGRVLIAGYHEITNDVATLGFGAADARPVVLGFNNAALLEYGANTPDGNPNMEKQVLGIPMVIGAKKGFPNFNEFGMQTQVSVTRKLQFRRPPGSNTGPIVETNQMYLVTITNSFGLEAWNSYLATYPRRLEVRMDAVLLTVVTNELGTLLLSNAVVYQPTTPAGIAQNTWRGYQQFDTTPNSFRAVVHPPVLVLTNSAYSDALHQFVVPGDFEQGRGFPTPHWYLSLRPMIRFALVDTQVTPNRIIDYVSLDSHQLPADLTPLLTGTSQCGNYYSPSSEPGAMWCTNRDNPSLVAPTYGILNQIDMALGNTRSGIASGNIQWSPDGHQNEVDYFRAQFPGPLSPLYYHQGNFTTTNTFDAPYSPQRIISFYTRWQANDPLVHYTIPDLLDSLYRRPAYELDTTTYSSMDELGGLDMFTSQRVGVTSPLNSHYRPWGGNPKNAAETSPPTNWKLEVKDPMVYRSDAWDFPTNKFANVGWLGRVHRGTAWQTIYLKSTTNDWATWAQWSGDTVMLTNNDFNNTKVIGALFSLPENDRSLLDLFSAAFNDAGARGRMGINQGGLAAWSAILSGVVVVTNTTDESKLKSLAAPASVGASGQLALRPMVVSPAGPFDVLNTSTNFWPAVAKIVNGINATRANRFANHTFSRLGDLLATPELTVASPFLNQGSIINPATVSSTTNRWTYQQSLGLTDDAYERIPQQILGLLQCDHTPRFVIYAYGQALKPADHSVINSGPYFQLCTNYQITAEVATRAVVRIDGAPTHPHAVIENFNVLPPD